MIRSARATPASWSAIFLSAGVSTLSMNFLSASPSSPPSRKAMTTTLLPNGALLAAGGSSRAGAGSANASVELYNPPSVVPAPVLMANFVEVATLSETSRGAGGFGSTGQ